MKMNKFLMLGIAGLAFAACSNDEEIANGFPEGTGAVTIKIAAPTVTKAIAAGHSANVEVVPADNSNVTITLTGSNSYSETITLTKDQWTAQQEVTFWNVETPQLVTVVMNDGKKTYTTLDLVETTALQAVENVPAYGETNQFTLTANTGKPTNGDPYEAGADADDVNTTYQLYSATVEMAIPMARLEVSGIKHVRAQGHGTNDCKYQTLTIGGVYLDNVIANGAGVEYAEGTGFSAATGGPTDYSFDGTNGTGIVAVLKDAATETDFGGTDFTAIDNVWPATGNVFGYNFFGATGENNMPKFKIYFDTSVAKDGTKPLPAPRYAMITKYWNEDKSKAITSFVPGHIYRITSAELDDENIIGDEGGNTLYGVEVTVEEATWTVETITADWAE